jgi:acetyl-CoA synthetase
MPCAHSYYSQYPGFYCTGDGAVVDSDGYYWITGRLDDVINVSGHRIGTAEVRAASVHVHAVSQVYFVFVFVLVFVFVFVFAWLTPLAAVVCSTRCAA